MPEEAVIPVRNGPGIPARIRRWALFAGKLAVSLTLLALLGRQVSWERVAARLGEVSTSNVLLGLLPLVGVTFFVALRWQIIATAVARPIRVTEAWIVAMIGAALDQILVTMSGDAYRMWWLNKGSPSIKQAVAGVLLDRVAGVLAIVALVTAFFPRLAALQAARGLLWFPAVLAGGLLGAFLLLLTLDRVPLNLGRSRWFAGIGLLSSLARRVFLSPRIAVPALASAVMAHIGVSGCIAGLAWALGAQLALAEALTVVPTVILISLLPISIGGWGVREGAMVVALGLVGVEAADALLISVMYGLGAALIGFTGGLLWLLGLPSRSGEIMLRH